MVTQLEPTLDDELKFLEFFKRAKIDESEHKKNTKSTGIGRSNNKLAMKELLKKQ